MCVCVFLISSGNRIQHAILGPSELQGGFLMTSVRYSQKVLGVFLMCLFDSHKPIQLY